MKKNMVFLGMCLINISAFAQSERTVTDIDGNIYKTIIYMGQEDRRMELMTENLKVTRYSDGTSILYLSGTPDWATNTTGAYAYYANSAAYKDLYGGLYNFNAVANPKGLCPSGWHIPNLDEWREFEYFADDALITGGNKLKSCRQVESILGGDCNTSMHPRWNSHDVHYGTDRFGFNGLPGGIRQDFDGQNGSFFDLGIRGLWWSSTSYQLDATFAYIRILNYSNDEFTRSPYPKKVGVSVRCIRDITDEPVIPWVITDGVQHIDNTTVQLSGTVVSQNTDILECGFFLSEQPHSEITGNKIPVEINPGVIVVTVFDLKAGANYYFRAYARNIVGTSIGEELQFQVSGAQYNVSISIDPPAAGVASGAGKYDSGALVEVNTWPYENNGYRFVSWTENNEIIQNQPDMSFIITSDRIFRANYLKNNFLITTDRQPASGGTVTKGGLFEQNSEITLNASSNPGCRFDCWTENDTIVSQVPQYTFSVMEDRHLVAVFSADTFDIAAIVIPEGSGTVNGTGKYPSGGIVSLVALPIEGYRFLRWMNGQDQLSVSNTYLFTAGENRELTAEFVVDWENPAKLSGNGSILITAAVDPPLTGIVLNQGWYDPNTEVRLVASPNLGLSFSAWMDDDQVILCENLAPCTQTLTFSASENRHLKAILGGEQFSVIALTEPSGSGTAEVTGSGTFFPGEFVRLNARAESGFEFSHWTENQQQVFSVPDPGLTVYAEHRFTAHFNPVKQYLLSQTRKPSNGGSISGTPPGKLPEGHLVSLTAMPAQGFVFRYWIENKEIISMSPEYEFRLFSDRTLEAWFAQTNFMATFNVRDTLDNPVHDATISLNDISYPQGAYEIGNLVPNFYSYEVKKSGWETVTGSFSIINSDVDISVVLPEITSDIKHSADLQTAIYPNPVRSDLYVVSDDNILEIMILDLTGRTVLHEFPSTSSLTLPVHNLQEGVYLIRIRNRNSMIERKIIIIW